MKKILCALLACTVCVSASAFLTGCGCSNNSTEPGYTVATTQPDLTNGDFGFYILNKNEIMITEYTGSSMDVEIPETFNDYTVTTIGEFVFSEMDITSVTIPDTVTEIQSYAFASCSSLANVKLSANLKTLGADAFFNCPSLESIEIPASVEDLGIYTFCGSGLKSVTIPESSTLTKLDHYVFYECKSLTEVNLPSTVTEISEDAFADCSNPITITAPSGSYAEEFASDNGFTFVAAQ